MLQVIQSLHFGGAERVVAQIATGVDRSCFDMRVACMREVGRVGAELAAAGIPVSSAAPMHGLARYLTSWHLWHQIRKFRPHAIHTHGLAAISAYGPLASLGLRVGWIHTFHYGNYPYSNRRHMALEGFFARRVPCLVAVAKRQRDAIVAMHRVRPELIAVVANGVRPNPHLNDPNCKARKRAEIGLRADEFVIGSICVMSEQKGIGYLLEAAALLVPAHPEVKFLLVGGGPLEATMRARAAELGLGNNVIFTGWRADAQELMLTLDVYVMSSLWEAMPLALLEAMAAGRAIVVTDVGDNADLVDRGKCALVVEPGDAVALQGALIALMRNRDLVDRLGVAALAKYQSNYTVSHMIDAYERLYRAT